MGRPGPTRQLFPHKQIDIILYYIVIAVHLSSSGTKKTEQIPLNGQPILPPGHTLNPFYNTPLHVAKKENKSCVI